MTHAIRRSCLAIVASVLVLAAHSGAVAANVPAKGALSKVAADDIRRSIDEKRLLDASRSIDVARSQGVVDPRLTLLTGELGLASHRYDIALKDFRTASEDPALLGEALQGQGLALIALGRATEAAPLLERAVHEQPKAWRAWNALGALYDSNRDWSKAEEAYTNAMEATDQLAIVLNNRGYSRLLQGKYDAALSDLVAALQKRADLKEARTNLRLTLALKGDYERALAGTKPDEQSSLLNNAGFAAGMRGDYGKAQQLLKDAIETRGEHFARAEANLQLVEHLAARGAPTP